MIYLKFRAGQQGPQQIPDAFFRRLGGQKRLALLQFHGIRRAAKHGAEGFAHPRLVRCQARSVSRSCCRAPASTDPSKTGELERNSACCKEGLYVSGITSGNVAAKARSMFRCRSALPVYSPSRSTGSAGAARRTAVFPARAQTIPGAAAFCRPAWNPAGRRVRARCSAPGA